MRVFFVGMFVALALSFVLIQLSASEMGRELTEQCMNNSASIGWQAK